MELALRECTPDIEEIRLKMRRHTMAVRVLVSQYRDVAMYTGHPMNRLPNHISLCIRNLNTEYIINEMNKNGISVSGSSACSSDFKTPSTILVACSVPLSHIMGAVGITTSKKTSDREIQYFCFHFRGVLQRARQLTTANPGALHAGDQES